jgi:hypothetical protein
MKRILALVAASAAISSAAPAQDTRSDLVACRDSATAGLYRRCALWIEGRNGRRGEEGTIVGRPGFFRPVAMTRIVAGDSAQMYAMQFERRMKQATTLQFIGGALLATAVGILDSRDCQQNIIGGCDYRDNLDWVAGSLAVGGIVIAIPRMILQVKAQRAGAKAVWWNNERFSR